MNIRQKCAFEHSVAISSAIRDMNMVPAEVPFTLSHYSCALELTLQKNTVILEERKISHDCSRTCQDLGSQSHPFQLHAQ